MCVLWFYNKWILISIIITDNAVESLKDVKISSLGQQLISAEECGTKREIEYWIASYVVSILWGI